MDDTEFARLGVPNAIPLVYEFDPSGRPLPHAIGKSLPPLAGKYLGEESVWFDMLDTHGTGLLGEEELYRGGLCVRDGEGGGGLPRCDALIERMDTNADGIVSFSDFVRFHRLNRKQVDTS